MTSPSLSNAISIFKRASAIATVSLLVTFSFSLVEAQTLTVLHAFTGGNDGGNPFAGLTADAAGNLYGTTVNGGERFAGTVYRLASRNQGWVLTPLYSFQGQSPNNDGAVPDARVAFGPNGVLYGTTGVGGLYACFDEQGCGIVFSLRPPASICNAIDCPWTETILYRFTGPDGAYPVGDLTFDQAGNLYGVTNAGGNSGCDQYEGDDCGVVYMITPGGSFSVLYKMPGGSGGSYPEAGVTFDSMGNLYGTTSRGGSSDLGVIFKLTPSQGGWTGTTLYQFQPGNGGNNPYAGLITDGAGNFYGATSAGGLYGGGTVFELSPSGNNWTYTVLYSFTGPGPGPQANLTMDSSGNLYGTTFGDGTPGLGSVFKLTHSGGNWSYTTLHNFTGGSDGYAPYGSVILDRNANVYGTTTEGGTFQYDGVIFEITP